MRHQQLPTGTLDWLTRRTSRAADWPPRALVEAKGGTRISVVIPAHNEEATIGDIVRVIRHELMCRLRLVDELLVVDSRSTDATARAAHAAGARVVRQDDVLGELPPADGKGDALWKGLAASSGDLVAFVDGDLRSFPPEFVTGLLGPLLLDQDVAYVKGFYHRPLTDSRGTVPDGGGRVTELVARPLINLHWPALAGFVQPLAGEYAGRREVLERVPFVTGYGVEIGLLVDLLHGVGLDALAQVDLGSREHSHQSIPELGRMATQILLTVQRRLAPHAHPLAQSSTALAQFLRGGSGAVVDREVVVTEVTVTERPPLAAVRDGVPTDLLRL
ncbi:glucosyl-3-phosphoglycerate synthase [Goodfellowiella coeruleoviolacea]|uniref:Glucosyl-3-phosphoglycerate synthase n=1 Tax=Goodfellowiella coeruleoviolacea TaxID=334858 RepID=A0AAE3G9T9_9PSEU|nr:glucosyl-3-phosphoglycerate synthase [Goodfellowiella coeruleoviolacea]MCP2163515.1 glucosyl-3-phosphoglycerate synthase [Goodfellowiella coeruleoviolacea]